VTIFLLLVLTIGPAPLALALLLTARQRGAVNLASTPGSVLLCALAFNLVFLWQETWLVIPKALTPGLHPILFHNNHEWTGDVPIAELLQGSGAAATLAIGLAFTAILAMRPGGSATTRLFCFWMGFQGLSQSLTQLAAGTVLPGNDVGRALTYLGLNEAGRLALLPVVVVGLAASGILLARLFPAETPEARVQPAPGIRLVALSAILSVVLIVPFRIPRSPIETTLIPLIVNLIGAGWTSLGFALAAGDRAPGAPARSRIAWPAVGLLALLLFFQLVLRRGISF
jgi:hypothetical protein